MTVSSFSHIATFDSLRELAYRFAFCAAHFIVGSVVFDLVHWVAHQSHRSPYGALRWLARAHSIHHRYFDRNLKYNEAFRVQNLLWHLPLELLCQVAGSTLSWLVSRPLIPRPDLLVRQELVLVLMIQVVRTCVVAWNSGHDSNHISYSKLPKDPSFMLVGPQYHALHHIDPQNYFGSMTRFVDWVFGTAVTFKGRRVAMTGSGGALGEALADELTLERVKRITPLRFGKDWTVDNYSNLEPILANTDILILAHGTKDDNEVFQANCESVIAIIELFKRCCCTGSKPDLLPEVWYVGSEAEFHGSWESNMQRYTESKRAFVPFARGYYDDKTFIYRHIVPSAFKSRMGPGLVSARWVARVALWWIRRGARYVPVTYTGFAYANFFRFLYWVKPCDVSAVMVSD